jgi:hypothetical protein
LRVEVFTGNAECGGGLGHRAVLHGLVRMG